MRIVRPVVRTVGSLSGTVRDMNRMRQVAVILAKHGFGLLVAGLRIPGLGHIRSSGQFETNPERTVAAIQELGPTFIKFGQILSTRPDIMPDAYIDELQTLQDDVEPIPFAQIEQVLEKEMGEDWKGQLSHITEKPLATASIAQVHRAQLQGGMEVVLKIQRPGTEKQIRSDLSILRFLMARALQEFPELELFDPQGIFREFERSILSELDFSEELRNLNRFRKNFEDMPEVYWPRPFEEYSSRRILCMEFLQGIKIREARAAGCDMAVVGERYIKVAYSMLFKHGFFHGDLHPGNVLVLENDVIGILDCGMIGHLNQEMMDYLASLLFALYRGDTRNVAKIFFDIAIKEERVDYMAFERDASEVVEKHWTGGSFAEMDIGAFMLDITHRALQHRVRASPAFTMFIKGVMTTEGLAKSLLPEVDPLAAAQPYVEKLIQGRWRPQKWSDLGVNNLIAYAAIGRRLPVSISQFLDDLDHQRLALQIHTHQSPKEIQLKNKREHTRLLTYMSFGWLGMGAVFLYFEPAYIYGVPVAAILFICFALSIQAWVLLRMWRL